MMKTAVPSPVQLKMVQRGLGYEFRTGITVAYHVVARQRRVGTTTINLVVARFQGIIKNH